MALHGKSETHWYEAVSSAFNFPFLKEVSQNYFVFDVVKISSFWSREIPFFENISQNCFFLDLSGCQLPLLQVVSHNCFLSDR